MLNEDGTDGRIECINGAASGLSSTELLDAFAGEWVDFQLDAVVVNLSYNDSGNPDFEENLHKISTLCHDRKIRPLFVLEAMSREANPGMEGLYDPMRRVAADEEIALVDAYGYLDARLDTGFLFWDKIHPTSYGYRLIAEFLAPAIRAELEKTPLAQ